MSKLSSDVVSAGSQLVERVHHELSLVMDPEIPVVSVVEMGMINSVTETSEGHIRVAFSPTFAGCPAVEVIARDMENAAIKAGATTAEVTLSYNPPWTSDRISEEARSKLLSFGLAPPPVASSGSTLHLFDSEYDAYKTSCPNCGSDHNRLVNPFGPTPCRALHVCESCQEPFEQFKPL